jgi:hypothetical protein
MLDEEPHDRVFRVGHLTKGERGRTLNSHLPPTRHAERPRVGLSFSGGCYAS